MSGSGRKSSYRKSVVEEYTSSFPLPSSDSDIVRVQGCRGANVFEVETISGTVDLAILPNKFKKLIWVKRNDYLIVEGTDGADEVEQVKEDGNGKLKYMVKCILSKEQIKHIKSQNLWPSYFDKSLSTSTTTTATATAEETKHKTSNITTSYQDDLMPGYTCEEEEVYEDETI